METTYYSQVLVLTPEDNKRLLSLCGHCNEHLHLIAERLSVKIKQRGFTLAVSGEHEAVENACEVLSGLYDTTQRNHSLSPQQVHLYIHEKQTPKRETPKPHGSQMDIRTQHAVITARGENQVRYIKNITHHDISFGIGPAGTGKTYLAVACAVHALETGRVSRIVLVRPIVEAGEKLGFLPGDLAQKVQPYLQPLYDALHEMLGFDQVASYMERGIIELAPLAYMRGRSLNDAFIILDEGQNTTVEQMKMFLTRIGFNSKAVVTGDVTQIDLTNHRESGLIQALQILKNVEGISTTQFITSDIVRHPLVQSIVDAYDKFNSENKK